MMRKEKGFSLIEMALVLALVSVILSFGLEGINGFDNVNRQDVTTERLNTIVQRLDAYALANGNFPCPARADRRVGVVTNDGQPEAGEATCLTSLVDGMFSGNALRGNVPVRDLNITDTFLSDGWGNKITYIVSNDFTSLGAGLLGNGSIVINYGLPASARVLTTQGAYALISHGPNGTGAAKSTDEGQCASSSTPDSRNCALASTALYDTDRNSNEGSTGFFDDQIIWYAADQQLEELSACATATLSWGGGCSASFVGVDHGRTRTANNTDSGFDTNSVATALCSDGVWQPPVGSCIDLSTASPGSGPGVWGPNIILTGENTLGDCNAASAGLGNCTGAEGTNCFSNPSTTGQTFECFLSITGSGPCAVRGRRCQ